MHRLQELVRLHRLKKGARETAERLQISPNTERRYRLAFAKAGLLAGPADELPTMKALGEALTQHGSMSPAPLPRSSIEAWQGRVETLMAKGLGARAIHGRLKEEDEAFQGSYWAVLRLCRRLSAKRGVRAEDVVIPVETQPGEIAQVDFGYVGQLMCPKQHVPRRAWVFVMVLGFSRHMYAEIVFDQKSKTWLRLHQRAFRAFGGVAETVVPDNLKAAVVRSAFSSEDEPALNRSYRELARHYGFTISPTPPYQPQKKGKVESAVKYIKRNVLAGRDGEDIDSVNQLLADWVEKVAGERIHGSTGKKPLALFREHEQAQLGPLPANTYDPVEWRQAKVHRDSYIAFDKRLYSVPWRLVGQEVWVRATSNSIVIFHDLDRIAVHQRNGAGKRSTIESHLPTHRRDWRHRSRSYWTQRAETIGPETSALVTAIFASDDVICQLRKVQAVVVHLEGFPIQRAEAAAQRALFYGTYNYRSIKQILAQGLDFESLPATVTASPPMQNPRFARTVNDLFTGNLWHSEEHDEPN